jgi:hypothetical protein
MAKKESKSKTKSNAKSNAKTNSKSNAKSKSKGSKGSKSPRGSYNAEELKMIKSPLTEAFNNRDLVAKSVGNTIRNLLIFNVIVGIVILVINVYAILWIHKLDTINCACSESYMRTYIKYYLYAFIAFICIDILMSLYILTSNTSILDLANNTLYNIYRNIRAVFSIFTIVNIVIVIIFINKLKEINCVCSEDIVREVYWIYNIVLACYLLIAFLIIIVAVIMMMFSGMSAR